MFQTIDKWMITATYESNAATIIFIYDNHYSNIIRKLSEIEFINAPVLIEIKNITRKPQE